MLRKNPVVSAAAVLSLSLAIGACAAAFTLIDALFLRPLPVRDPARLVSLVYSPHERRYFKWEYFDRLAEAAGHQVELFGFGLGSSQPAIFDDSGGEEERLQTQWISGDAFRILGIQPAIGRVFTGADDGHAVAVLSYSFWTRRFAASPAVIGHWFNFRGTSLQIIGVAQKGFSGLLPGYREDVWFPRIGMPFWEFVWGHLKPGVQTEQARQVLQVAFTNYRREHPGDSAIYLEPGEQLAEFRNAKLDLRSAPASIATSLHTDWDRPLWILASVAGLVLLIACSNVANLLVARGVARQREMALRISIGASRTRLIQQLLIESSLLAGAACVLGLAFASATASAVFHLMTPSHRLIYDDLHLDARILPFLALIGVSTTLLFGLAPAMRASAVAPQGALKGGPQQSAKIGILQPVLASQVAFSYMVLFVAALLLLSLQKLTNVDLGFSRKNVLLVELSTKVPSSADARGAGLKLVDQIRHVPGVQAASLSGQGLFDMDRGPSTTNIRVRGLAIEPIKPYYLAVSPGFLATMQMNLVAGRDFTTQDIAPNSTAVVVNQSFTGHYFPGENPLGKRFEKIGKGPLPDQQEIVGVVRDTKYKSVREANLPIVYEALGSINGTLEVRMAADPLSFEPVLRREIQRINPGIRITNFTLQSTQVENSMFRERLVTLLAGFFAGVAIVLAAIGLYGVLSYSVVRRTKEIGIRIALGARQRGVVRLVMSDILLMVAFGVAAGIAGGLAFVRFVTALLFEAKPSGFWSLVLPLVCLLSGIALAAVPVAFRTARVDPIAALRQE